MSKVLTFVQSDLPSCCGVKVIGEFDAVHVPEFNEKEPWRHQGYSRKPHWWSDDSTENERDDIEDARRALLDESSDAEGGVIASPTGVFVATFNQEQKEEYELACQRFTLLSQSPPRRSSTTRSFIFVCVFEQKPVKNKLPKL